MTEHSTAHSDLTEGRIQEAWGWCPGMTQGDGMGREVEGRFKMGSTCIPMADAC